MESRLVPSVVNLHAGSDLQTAINNARPGDQLILDAGATFSAITLPNKGGDQWITIQSSALSSLPAPGQRVGPQDAAFMPKITSPGSGAPALQTAAGANHYRFVGIEFLPASSSALVYDLIDLGDGSGAQTSLTQVPHDLTFDQCYVHTWLDQPAKRGIALNSAATSIVNSYIAGFKENGQDSQAIAGWNGPGPFKIDNNYLEGAGENILFGGASATIPNLVPSDIEIKGNLVSKPLAWNNNDPSTYAGKHWTVKNLLELKNAQRVTIDGNRFENNWLDAQVGFAIVFTPRGAQSGGPWATVNNVNFTNNMVTHTAQGVDILGSDDSSTSKVAQNILIQNNLFQDIGAARWGPADGRAFQLLTGLAGGTKGVVIDHNTVTSDTTLMLVDGVHTGFGFTNNIAPSGVYGVLVNTLGSSLTALQTAFPSSTFQGNAIVGGNPGNYPANNMFPSSWQSVGFVNFGGGDFHLAAGSPLIGKGTSGTNPGVNMDSLQAALNGSSVSVDPVAASRLVLTGFPSSITAGAAGTFTVTATDANGNTVPGYRGTIHFSSNNSQAVLPADYTFTAADNGVHTFSATFKTAGTWSLTATDTTTSSITGTQTAITVNSVAASRLVLTGFPSSLTAGTATTFTVTASDANGQTLTGYRGTIHFSSSDPQATLPADYTFTAADNGVHSFSASFKTAGTWSLTATDTTSSSITGTITVNATTPNSQGGKPDVTYHGGPLLQHVQVESIYYGQAWSNNANLQQQIPQLDGFLKYFTSSPYMDVLKEYNVGSGTFLDHDVIAQNPAGGTSLDDSQIRTLLNSEITAQHVGAPTSDRLYVLFTAPGVSVTFSGVDSVHHFTGYHSVFTDSAGVLVYYAVVPYPTGGISTRPLTAFQQDTIILSHEISEAVTDPDTQTGWFDPNNGEIGDIAQGQFGVLGGYAIQGVWSQAQQQIVVPTATSGATFGVTGVPVQTAAGQPFTGLVATLTGAAAGTTASSYTATINWGNGSASAGTIAADPNGGFDVHGKNTYAQAGSFKITVTVHDQTGTVVGTASTSAKVLRAKHDTSTNAAARALTPARVAPAPPIRALNRATANQLSVTGLQSSLTAGAAGTTTVSVSARQDEQASISSVNVGGAIPESGLPAHLVGDPTPTQVISFATAPAGKGRTLAQGLQPRLNGTQRAATPVFGMPSVQELKESGVSFWLDERQEGTAASPAGVA